MKLKKPHGPPREIGQYLVVDPRVCHGQLTFKGTRLPVKVILYYLSKGQTIEQLLEDWPELRPEALAEAINLAAESLVQRSGAWSGEPDDEPARAGRSVKHSRTGPRAAQVDHG